MTGGWEHFEHGADVGVRGTGPTMAEAFAHAAVALTAAICDPASVRTGDSRDVVCRAPTPELLLVDWLNAVVYTMATERMVFGAFTVSVLGEELRGRLHGEPVDRERHQPAVEVKGATHTALRVAQDERGDWVAQCVIDV